MTYCPAALYSHALHHGPLPHAPCIPRASCTNSYCKVLHQTLFPHCFAKPPFTNHLHTPHITSQRLPQAYRGICPFTTSSGSYRKFGTLHCPFQTET